MTREPTVFIVDNDAEARSKLSALVTTMGWPSETYASGQQFLDAYDPSRPGCAVMEVRLSRMSGLQVRQQLEEMGAVLPIIFLTTHANVAIAVQALREGAFHFLEKPFREQPLWETICDAIALDEQRRAEQQQRDDLDTRIASLNDPERIVLDMILDGNNNKNIADELGVSIRTIEKRRSGVMGKLDAKSFADLIRIGLVGTGKNEAMCQCGSPRLSLTD